MENKVKRVLENINVLGARPFDIHTETVGNERIAPNPNYPQELIASSLTKLVIIGAGILCELERMNEALEKISDIT